MIPILQILALLTVSIAMALALAHALEFPGKLRLSRADYETVQQIYYPGFTYGGASEILALLLSLILLLFTPLANPGFWLVLASLAVLAVMHAIYWFFIHPINSFWLKDFELTGFGARFFSFGSRHGSEPRPEWTALRNRWEYAHVARAVLGLFALGLLGSALAF